MADILNDTEDRRNIPAVAGYNATADIGNDARDIVVEAAAGNVDQALDVETFKDI